MCLPIHQRDPRTRIAFAIANLSLAAGLILRTFVRPSLAAPHAWVDAVSGFLIGVSIVGNLFALVRSRRCRQQQV